MPLLQPGTERAEDAATKRASAHSGTLRGLRAYLARAGVIHAGSKAAAGPQERALTLYMGLSLTRVSDT